MDVPGVKSRIRILISSRLKECFSKLKATEGECFSKLKSTL